MKVVVTGGCGFIGTNLIKRLVKDGHNVVSLDNYYTGKKENEVEGCKYYDVDLRETHDLSFFMDKPDVIYHLAALARIQPSFKEPSETIDTNQLATQRVLEWARTNGNIPVVYAGSSSVHGNVYSNPYSFSKWQGEELCKLYSEIYDLPTTICRFYNVYGPHQLVDGPYCTVIGIFQKQYEEGKPLTITWDGEQRRDFTHVDDIVDGLYRCSDYRLFRGEIFELGSGENYSINEVAGAFGDYPYDRIPKRDGEMRETLCVDTKAHELLDWKPQKNLIKYLKDFVNETN